MDDRKLNQMADDIHLITTPVRIVANWVRIILFLLALPVVFIVSVVHWLFTGEPIMSPDELWLTKVLLTVLSPFIAMFISIFHEEWRRIKDPEYGNPIPAPIVFVVTLFLMLALVKCNFLFGWGFYNLGR